LFETILVQNKYIQIVNQKKLNEYSILFYRMGI